MFVYNITVKVDNEILQQWLRWQREVHVPEFMATDLFTESKFFKLLEQDDSAACTYILQYFISTKENYNTFVNEYAPVFAKKSLEKWGNGFVDFKTFMQTVH